MQSERAPAPEPRPRIWRERFESSDLDETRDYFRHKFNDRSRVPSNRGPFYYSHEVAVADRAALGTARTRLPQTMRTAVSDPMLYLPLRGMDQYQVGRRSLVSDPGTAMLLAPGWDYTCHSQPNDWLCLSVSGELLAEEIATRRRSGSRAWRCRTVALPLAPRRATELLQIHRRMLALTLAAPTAADVAAVERDAAAWLATIVLERSGEIRLARSTLLRIEQLERWIDAHLGEQVTLDSLSAASGICPRALQKAVLALRGQSPLEWVRSRRLAAVNARLQAGGARTNIAQVALDLGFTHLGRFSSLYRRAYGELPSATLAQARTRHRTREGRAPPGRRRPLQT